MLTTSYNQNKKTGKQMKSAEEKVSGLLIIFVMAWFFHFVVVTTKASTSCRKSIRFQRRTLAPLRLNPKSDEENMLSATEVDTSRR